MEAENTSQEETSKKRPSEHVSEDEVSKPKKLKLYSVKHFRKQLNTNEKLQGILKLSHFNFYTNLTNFSIVRVFKHIGK